MRPCFFGTPYPHFAHAALLSLIHLRYSVHAHAAAALINFCEGVERNTLIPYLDPIVERLLKLLNPTTANPKRYVQEQVITTLAMVADASEATFAKVCSSLLLLRGAGRGAEAALVALLVHHAVAPQYSAERERARV